jgi:hypothetical protein
MVGSNDPASSLGGIAFIFSVDSFVFAFSVVPVARRRLNNVAGVSLLDVASSLGRVLITIISLEPLDPTHFYRLAS